MFKSAGKFECRIAGKK